MKKLLLILLLIPFGLAAQVYTPPVNASLFSGLDSSNFVVTFNRNQTILGTKSFSDPTIFNDDLTVTGNIGLTGNIDATTITVGGSYTFPSSDGTVNQIIKTDGSGNLSFIANAAFSGAIGFDATNLSAVRIFRASDTITESWGHSHNEYLLATGGVVNGNVNFNSDAQADDDYEISLVGITALKIGMTVTFIANTINTDGCTLEITEVGDVDAILKMNDQALASGDIEAGQVVVCVWDGSNWQLISQIAQ